jgi:hypothetical protein
LTPPALLIGAKRRSGFNPGSSIQMILSLFTYCPGRFRKLLCTSILVLLFVKKPLRSGLLLQNNTQLAKSTLYRKNLKCCARYRFFTAVFLND